MLLGNLGASLWNLLSAKGIVRAGSGNKKGRGIVRADYGNKMDFWCRLILNKLWNKYQNEPRFNRVFSRANLP